MSLVSLYKSPLKILVTKCFLYQVGILGLGLVVCFEGVTRTTGLALNQSESLPQKVFLVLKGRKIHRESYLSFQNDWFKGSLIKQVIGIEGDKIITDEQGEIWIARRVGKPLPHSKDGKILHPITPGIIPPGYVFTYAPHSRSFDSRYQEVGLVQVDKTLGLAIPLF